MVRKILIFLTILLITFLGYYFFKLFREKEVAVNSLFDAVPVDASVIIEVNRPELLFDYIHTPPVNVKPFLDLPFLHEPFEKLQKMDSLLTKYESLKNLLMRPHSLMISGHPLGKDQLEMVYYLKLNNPKEYSDLDKMIANEIRAKGNISQHKYDDALINDLAVFNKRSENFSYTFYRGIFIMSGSPILVEEVIRQTKSNFPIRTKQGLENVIKTAGKSSPFNVYVNYSFIPRLALNFIHSRFKTDIESLSQFAQWIELDCNLQKDAIILNGFSEVGSSDKFMAGIFNGLEPVKLELPKQLPSGTKSFLAFGISDYKKFRENFKTYQEKAGNSVKESERLSKLEQTYGKTIVDDFSGIFDGEVCLSYFPQGMDTLSNSLFTIIKTKGNAEAKRFLISSNEHADRNHTPALGKEKSKIAVAGNEAIHCAFNIPEMLFGKLFTLNGNKYCTLADDYLIFGDTIPNLNAFTADFQAQKNFAIDVDYSNLSDLLSENAYFYFYLTPGAQKFYRYFARYSSDLTMAQYNYALSQTQAIVYQFGKDNGLFYNNFFIRFLPKENGAIGKCWEVQLDNSVVSEISLLKNHTDKSTEIMCQDKEHNLYLISASGEVLWKRKFDKPILSKLFQADLFRNKKLQVIFNTEDKIFAVDRNGKDVEGFPVSLKVKASGGMALFDYDKTRNYRLLLPGKDNVIYCFDKTGKEMEGWAKPVLKSPIVGEIAYNTFNGKDYITTCDKTSVYFFDRRGITRITPSREVRIGENSQLLMRKGKKTAQFVCTDSTGRIVTIALNGAVSSIQTGIYPKNHYFMLADADSDGEPDYFFFFDKKAEVYNSKGARIASYMLDAEITRPARVITPNDSTLYIAYSDTNQRKMFLLGKNGKGIKGDVLEGDSEISYEILQKPNNGINLYLADKNILYCYSVK